MAPKGPKPKLPAELGGVVANSRQTSFRVQVQFGKHDSVPGPWQPRRAFADDDLRRAQACSTRDEMRTFLKNLQRREDGRSSNAGTPSNRGNQLGRLGKRLVPSRKVGVQFRRVLSKFAHKTYRLQGLDLRMARIAGELHRWSDQCTVTSLMEVLEKGNGCMDISTYHFRKRFMGRLWLTYPTPLHVNRQFRSTLFWLQRDCYTDVDMVSAHNHIAIYLAGTQGKQLTAIPEYVIDRESKHAELLGQKVDGASVKKL